MERHPEGVEVGATRKPEPWELPYTGYKGHLSQDICAGLSAWFASRVDARLAVRKACKAIQQEQES